MTRSHWHPSFTLELLPSSLAWFWGRAPHGVRFRQAEERGDGRSSGLLAQNRALGPQPNPSSLNIPCASQTRQCDQPSSILSPRQEVRPWSKARLHHWLNICKCVSTSAKYYLFRGYWRIITNNKMPSKPTLSFADVSLSLSTTRLPFSLMWSGRDKGNVVQRSWILLEFKILLPYRAPWLTSELQSVRARADWVNYQCIPTLYRLGASPEAGTCPPSWS